MSEMLKNISIVKNTDGGQATEIIEIPQSNTTDNDIEDLLKHVLNVETLPDKVLANNSPDVIQKVAHCGLGSLFWSVGDKIGISLNGKVSQLTFNNETYYATIIGFNHNPLLEESNSIHFQFGTNSDNKDIAFISGYSDDSDFYMNSNGYNYGGWKNSFMRNTVCNDFYNAMPQEWQKVITPCTKYSDNTGGGYDNPSYISATQDKIWLLAEYEVFGYRDYANSAEQNYQQQYEYYKNGGSKVRYRHDQPTSSVYWWLRSAYYYYNYSFCSVHSDGDTSHADADISYGVAPGFMLA